MRGRYIVLCCLSLAAVLLGFFCYWSSRLAGNVGSVVLRDKWQLMEKAVSAAEEKEKAEDVAALNQMNAVSEEEKQKGFYLRISGGEVVVYRRDGKTLYEKTGLRAERIPDNEARRLENGYVVKNKKELYSILENLSS